MSTATATSISFWRKAVIGRWSTRYFSVTARGGIATTYDVAPNSDRSYSGLLVDLDGDGNLDIVISNDAHDPKRVYFNDGSGHFTVSTTFGNPSWERRNATVADLNADGMPDIVSLTGARA